MGLVAAWHVQHDPMACGIFLDQELNPCLLHWQVDSLPLSHMGGPSSGFFFFLMWTFFKAFLKFCYNIASVLCVLFLDVKVCGILAS